jgi:putative transposase
MGGRRKSRNARDTYAFIKEHRNEFETALMCRVLGVSRSGYYEWLGKPLSDRAIEDQRLLGLIRASYAASHGVYGAPRIFLDLREAGETCSKHRVARIMRINRIKEL